MPLKIIRYFSVTVLLPAAIAALTLASIIAALLIFGAATAKWGLARRKSVSEHLDYLAASLESNPGATSAYLELAEATNASNDWDRMAAFVQIRHSAPSIAGNPESHTLFTKYLLPCIRSGLTDLDAVVRRESALAACEYGPLIAPIKDTLLQVAREHPNQDCAWFSVRAIGNMGSAATDMVDALKPLMQFNSAIADEVEEAIIKLTSSRRLQ